MKVEPMQTNKPKGVPILDEIFKYWLVAVFVLSGLFFGLYGMVGVYSTVLGSVFSLLGLRQLSDDQYHILISKNRKKVFISFLLRLGYLCYTHHRFIKISKLF